MMHLPGMTAKHYIVSDSCREAHGGFLEALDEAYRRMRESIEQQYVSHWEPGRGDEFHLALSADLTAHRAEPKGKTP